MHVYFNQLAATKAQLAFRRGKLLRGIFSSQVRSLRHAIRMDVGVCVRQCDTMCVYVCSRVNSFSDYNVDCGFDYDFDFVYVCLFMCICLFLYVHLPMRKCMF
jgi:hypothetical protein